MARQSFLEEQENFPFDPCLARHPPLDTDPGPLSRPKSYAQHSRACHHGRAADSALASDVGNA